MTQPFKTLVVLFLMCLAFVASNGRTVQARTLPSIQDELIRTTGAINDQERVIKEILKRLDAEELKLENATKRHDEHKRVKKFFPKSKSRDDAIRRSLDDIIRAQKEIQDIKNQYKVEIKKWRALLEKKAELEKELKNSKKDEMSLDEAGKLLAGNFRSRFRSNTAQNNKEDRSIESQSLGGVVRSEISEFSPMMSYP